VVLEHARCERSSTASSRLATDESRVAILTRERNVYLIRQSVVRFHLPAPYFSYIEVTLTLININ
jgi:hypothetical protein